ncbi:TetR/AcrR family transcriptional regulator [Blastococcus sp. URHD0036]|uniref:TetR/AcrR family transcriptional regulator n=1 Tax=Blastococcus sp. URHD0036 TaxID=1380356 RepID=UPI0004981623|nr:TetR/AcrR family transcriptional regulator [Blastococcus sp. URHD0036]
MTAADTVDPLAGGTKRVNHRQRQAAATRETVARAALDRFAEQGYARTTVEDIARAAGVSVQTVYAIFGSKREILVDLRKLWFSEADVTRLVDEALQEPNPRRRLQLTAKWIRHQHEVGSTLSMVIEEAVRADQRVADTWTSLRSEADDRIHAVIAGIGDALATGLDVDSAVDVVWALSRTAVYREFLARGWSPDRYEHWLGLSLHQQLLGTRSIPAARPEE